MPAREITADLQYSNEGEISISFGIVETEKLFLSLKTALVRERENVNNSHSVQHSFE